MAAILASYQASGANTSDIWKDICESLSNDMIDRPYLRSIFAYIASNDWYRVLDEPGLPLRERMAIALRVLDDEQVIKKKSDVDYVYHVFKDIIYRCQCI